MLKVFLVLLLSIPCFSAELPSVTDPKFADDFENEVMLKNRSSNYWTYLATTAMLYTVHSGLSHGWLQGWEGVRSHIQLLEQIVEHGGSASTQAMVLAMANLSPFVAKLVHSTGIENARPQLEALAKQTSLTIKNSVLYPDYNSFSNVFLALAEHPNHGRSQQELEEALVLSAGRSRYGGFERNRQVASALFYLLLDGKTLGEALQTLEVAKNTQSRAGGTGEDRQSEGQVIVSDLVIALAKSGLTPPEFFAVHKGIRERVGNIDEGGRNGYLALAKAAAPITRIVFETGTTDLPAGHYMLPYVPVVNLNKLACGRSIMGPIPNPRGITFGY